MTVGVLARVMLRRWAVVLVGVLMTALVCSLLINAGRTYWASVDLVFLQPGESAVANVSDSAVPSLISFAGIVKRRASQDGTPVELPSSNATLYGSGVRNGYSITLPNTGTQWAVSYSRPVLAVQVVGGSPDQVRQTVNRVLTMIEVSSRELQSEQGVPAKDFITLDRSPETPEIVDLGSSKTGRVKGLLALSMVGLALTALAALEIDRLVMLRTRSRSARNEPS
ncbi:hypothetical protein [Pseudarthrobacter sulfonivorans]|uniref:hypothetical protein n=1 Tax=Pseudarthrobacter sulfonivorans TaxID=121292 RepID=UPI002102110E|nr:hypothetical protein [Pseudarthrobacter sulfonivorans]